MDAQFLFHLLKQHEQTEAVPPTKEIAGWGHEVIRLLFPQQGKSFFRTVHELEGEWWRLADDLKQILRATDQCRDCNIEEKVAKVFAQIPDLYRLLQLDVQAILAGDPAAQSEFEVIRAYPGFFAISFYRLAHSLHQESIQLIPRILTEYAHSRTGIDIHPGAVIGPSFFIDHGTGVVIGETSHIGAGVKIYQGVTLGALSVRKSMANQKRHPTVEDDVVIYSGATILGGETVIGKGSIIGGNVWLTESVPSNSRVYHTPEVKVVEKLPS
ncbi:MAG: serine O-acetyltransferase [Spirosomataceae bacterium]